MLAATEAAKSERLGGIAPARAMDMAWPITLSADGAGGADGSMSVAWSVVCDVG